MTLQLPIIRADVEILATVELELSRSSKGQRGRFGEPLEPDERGDFEITSSKPELTREEEAEAVDLAWREIGKECEL